jgi:hypothetical protein
MLWFDTDVSEDTAAAIFSTDLQNVGIPTITKPHGAITQKTMNYMFTSMKT